MIIVVGIFYFTGQHTGSQKANLVQEQPREKVLGKTILISPFQNKSGLKDFDAIADGISDHLISSLSPTTLLKVLPRKQSQFAKEQNFTLMKYSQIWGPVLSLMEELPPLMRNSE